MRGGVGWGSRHEGCGLATGLLEVWARSLQHFSPASILLVRVVWPWVVTLVNVTFTVAVTWFMLLSVALESLESGRSRDWV